jgi:putative DNA primase/helicase
MSNRVDDLSDLLGPDPAPPSKSGLVYTRADKIRQKAIVWIWNGHLALGHHTCIAGIQGDGKSMLVYALAAAVTRGGTFPGSDQKAPLGNVIILNAEDRDEDMLAPRIEAAGADMTKVWIVQAAKDRAGLRKFSLITDLEKLRKMCAEIGDVKFISFDPVSSYLGGDVDSHSNTELRNALDPITAMANDTGAAVVSVTHFNKSAMGSALNQVMGGAGFTAAPRAADCVVRDAKNPLIRMLLPLKTNLASEGSAYGMTFTVAAKKIGVDPDNGKDIIPPYIVWGNKTTITADEALSANNKKIKGPTKQEEAESFLVQMLGRGPVLVRDVEAASDKRGIAPDTLRRAKKGLGVISEKISQLDGRGPWMMSLPDGFFPEGSTRPAPMAGEEPDFDWPDAKKEFGENGVGDDDPADRVLN